MLAWCGNYSGESLSSGGPRVSLTFALLSGFAYTAVSLLPCIVSPAFSKAILSPAGARQNRQRRSLQQPPFPSMSNASACQLFCTVRPSSAVHPPSVVLNLAPVVPTHLPRTHDALLPQPHALLMDDATIMRGTRIRSGHFVLRSPAEWSCAVRAAREKRWLTAALDCRLCVWQESKEFYRRKRSLTSFAPALDLFLSIFPPQDASTESNRVHAASSFGVWQRVASDPTTELGQLVRPQRADASRRTGTRGGRL